MGLRLHLIALIIFVRACASVARVEADTLLVSFEVRVRSLCGFDFQFFSKQTKRFLIMNFSRWRG